MKDIRLEYLGQAIKYLKSEKIITDQGDIATDLGYTRETTISEIVNGKVNLSPKFVKAFCSKYSISESFIQTGKGDMKSKSKPLTEGERMRLKKAIGDDSEDPGIIYVPIAAQMGYSRNFEDPLFINDLDRLYVPASTYKGDKFRCFDAEGDSMEPTILEGMQVISEKIEQEDWKHIKNFYMYVIVIINRIMIKRLYKKDEHTFVMISDNEDFHPQEPVKLEEIKELWLVKRVLDWRLAPPKKFEIKI